MYIGANVHVHVDINASVTISNDIYLTYALVHYCSYTSVD